MSFRDDDLNDLILLQVEVKLIASLMGIVSRIRYNRSLGKSISWTVEGERRKGLGRVVKVLSLGLIVHISKICLMQE